MESHAEAEETAMASPMMASSWDPPEPCSASRAICFPHRRAGCFMSCSSFQMHVLPWEFNKQEPLWPGADSQNHQQLPCWLLRKKGCTPHTTTPHPTLGGCCSVTKLCPTLCDPMDCSTPGFLSFTLCWSWLTLMNIESMMPCNRLILCRPLLLLFS